MSNNNSDDDDEYDQELEEKLQKMQKNAMNVLTEAYEDFKDRLCIDYLILSVKQQAEGGKFQHMQKVLKMREGNSSAGEIDGKTSCAKLFCWLILPYIWYKTRTIFEVEANKFAFVVESSKEQGERTVIYGPGYHILGYGYKLEGIYSLEQDYPNNIMTSSVGDLKIAKVEQGYIMHLMCGGQNILLGPGFHKITEPMEFKNYVSLDSFFINIGTEKWITIPTGYDGISLNRGRIQVLHGGSQHYLQHVSEKFVKMVPKTIQNDKIPTDIPSYVSNLTQKDEDNIKQNQAYKNQQQSNRGGAKNKKNMQITGRMQHQSNAGSFQKQNENDPTLFLLTTTAEGSTIILDTMLQWVITDTRLAALTAMEILKVGVIGSEQTNEEDAVSASSKNICNLRQTVLRISKNHLTSMVGSINLAGKTSMGAAIKQKQALQVKKNENIILEDPEDEEEDESQKLIPKKKQQGKKAEPQKAQKKKDDKSNFDILTSLQGKTNYLRDLINQDLVKIGCKVESVSIYRVSPSAQIQSELDKQTKAKVDANTEMIRVQSDKQSSDINQNINIRNAKIQAETDAEVQKYEAQSFADSEITRANGEADAIITVAKARREEAEQLQEYNVAKQLALTRVAGEAGQQIFQGDSNNFVFGQNPGDVLFNMIQGFSGKNKNQQSLK